jgi:hypothetical protein
LFQQQRVHLEIQLTAIVHCSPTKVPSKLTKYAIVVPIIAGEKGAYKEHQVCEHSKKHTKILKKEK